MCGICGIFDIQARLTSIVDMNHIQRHRGPDDEGYLFVNTHTGEWQEAGGLDTHFEVKVPSSKTISTENYDLALGNRRLAILDLSSAGHMPMSYHDGNLWITHNGEIYNYKELRADLVSLGYDIKSDTDTEVILAAYTEWGPDCLSHFNGMFAFTLWDARRKRLFCARDRFGIKPFYYFWNGSTFVFGSEIKSVLLHPAVPRVSNDQSIFEYFGRGLSDHNEKTFFEGISSLNPGHFLLLDVSTRQLRKESWWDVEINPGLEPKSNGNHQSYAEFAELLEDAVRIRLRSDVPVGTCLSGGLDSSSIVCLANGLLMNEKVIPLNLVGEHQKTFTARNKEAEIDEYKYSNLVVQQTGAEENLVYPDGETLWKEIESFVWHMDEPVDSTSQYPQWNVMRLARQRGVTVLLDGQGGDELLTGYYYYYPSYVSQILQDRGWPAAIRTSIEISRVGGSPVINTLYQHALYQIPWRLNKILSYLKPPQKMPGVGGSGLQEWQLSKGFIERFWDNQWQPPGEIDLNNLASILYLDLTSTNLPKLLRYEDRNSMAFSLETRLPFLDYRLVEMVYSLPLNYRIHNGWNKWILRHSLKNILPKEITRRRGKLGFPTPEVSWMRQGSQKIRQLLEQHDNEQLAPYFQPGALKKIREQPDEELAATPGLWRIVNLIIWLDLYFNNDLQDVAERVSQANQRQLT